MGEWISATACSAKCQAIARGPLIMRDSPAALLLWRCYVCMHRCATLHVHTPARGRSAKCVCALARACGGVCVRWRLCAVACACGGVRVRWSACAVAFLCGGVCVRWRSHLSQLLAGRLVLRPLAEVFHTLILGQKVLLLGHLLPTVPLVQQLPDHKR